MKRIALTGASGFVGSQIFNALSKEEYKLLLISRSDDFSKDSADNVEYHITKNIFLEKIDDLSAILLGVDTLIHAAWYVEPGKYLQSAKNLDCLTGTVTLAKACVQAGVRRFVGIGTCFEYDLSFGRLSVETPLKPTTPYAASKAAAFFALSQYFLSKGVEFAWCRLFYLYGEGEDERRLVPYLRKQLADGEVAELTNGNQVRDFLDVREAGRLIAEIAQGQRQGPINICSGKPITVRQLAEKIADEYEQRDLLRFGIRHDNTVDPPCVIGIK
jgi:dTDP-6-deoxy-L-talose 4-dehydrogenase (NAD+)